MMSILTSDQNRGIAKGFGLGMGAVLLAYAGLFAWASINGPDAVKAHEDKLVSRTVVMERVLPISPALKADATSEPHAEPSKIDEHAAAPHTDSPAEHPPEKLEPEKVETAKTEPVKAEAPPAKPSAGEDPQLKGAQRYANGMVVAPVDGLYAEGPQGRLPVKRPDGLTPFKAYKSPGKLDGNKPVISIAITDMGLSDKLTEVAVKTMPPEVSLIVSPYATAIETWMQDAREAGHEVWLSLPMESNLYPRVDTGPHTLLVGAPERENTQKLEWVMGRAVGYTGLVANYSDVFMNAPNDARAIVANIYKRGLAFVDSRGAGGVAQTTAASMNAPYTNVNVWIDKPENTPETIKASLSQLEVIAREGGFAAGVISANNVSFREVKDWLETLGNKGFVLAPLSAQAEQ